ncbi:MAG: hypothetical protein M3Q70_03630 [bacterium]|nr:hypothetical protein [bacterium]
MSLLFSEQTYGINDEPYAFQLMDSKYQENPLDIADKMRFGEFVVTNTCILETPPDVPAGEILTNPSQLEEIMDGPQKGELFAYFRREPIHQHLGNTLSVPYILKRSGFDQPYLISYGDAMIVEGEDPRLIRNIPYLDKQGNARVGWCVSTVIATPKAADPYTVESIEQVFYCGDQLDELELVHSIPGLKNTVPSPIDFKGQETPEIDVFGRPHPHISYAGRVKFLNEITPELVNDGILITEGLLARDVHTGVNNIKRNGNNSFELDIHEACAPLNEERKKQLHYRLGRYAYSLPDHSQPKGILRPLSIVAKRSDFPFAEPKPATDDVADYTDILYGSQGDKGCAVVGVSDRYAGYMEFERVH